MSDESERVETVPGQTSMFDQEAVHRAWGEWGGMPEFIADDKVPPFRSIIVHFASRADVDRFALAVEQPIGPKSKSLWYPRLTERSFADKRYISDEAQR